MSLAFICSVNKASWLVLGKTSLRFDILQNLFVYIVQSAYGSRYTHLLPGSRPRLLDQSYPTASAIVSDCSVPFSDCSIPFSDFSDSRFHLLLTFSDCSVPFPIALAVVSDCSVPFSDCSVPFSLLSNFYGLLSTFFQLLSTFSDCSGSHF